jgi:two-component system response regulator
VDVLSDGADALAWIFGTGRHADRGVRVPVLLLLDLELPSGAGLRVLQTLRSDARTQRVAVVVVASSTADQDIARAYELGANSYVRKPVDVDDVAEVVRQLGLYCVLLNEPVQA